MPYYQGELDSLCGMYAVVNAMALCGLDAEREALFEAACSAARDIPWPRTVWNGTTYADIKRMVRSCVDSKANRIGVRARYPLRGRWAATNSEFWSIFDDAFEAGGAVCAVIGLTKPDMHWVAVVPDGGRIAFYDSCAERSCFRKNRASLYAGLRRSRPNQWMLDRRELVVFHN